MQNIARLRLAARSLAGFLARLHVGMHLTWSYACIVRCMRIFCGRRSREHEIRKRHALTAARSANIFQRIERIFRDPSVRYSILDIEARPRYDI